MSIFLLKCGGGEIRTHDRVSPTPHFECGAFNHSATPPSFVVRDRGLSTYRRGYFSMREHITKSLLNPHTRQAVA